MLIDSHCHIHEPWFADEEIQQIVKNARNNGVTHIINCASSPKHFSQVLKSGDIESISVTLGIQPTYVDNFPDATPLRAIEDLDTKIVAIGEIGLDYYWVKKEEERIRQESLFIDCLELANELSLPVVIHTRKAESASLDILERHAQTPVLLHSFEGNLLEINRAKDLGYKITIPSNVIRRKNRRKVAIRAELENILLETDAPFCSTQDNIKRNEPAYIKESASYIAKLLETDLEVVADVTTRNSKLFHNL